MLDMEYFESLIAPIHGALVTLTTTMERLDMLDRIDPNYSPLIAELDTALDHLEKALKQCRNGED